MIVDLINSGCVEVGDSATVGRILEVELETVLLLLGRFGNGMMAGGLDFGLVSVG